MAPALLILISLLTVGFLSTRIASQLRTPHSVFLVGLGVAAGLVVRGSASAVWAGNYDQYFPQVVLFVLLPPLIFESAYHLDASYLRRDVLPLTVLAAVALGLSTLFIGVALHRCFGLELFACLTFGALISATDPVAVVALFKEVGAPKRLTMLVEGESLLNDGTAIVLFRALLLVAMGDVAADHLLRFVSSQVFLVPLGGVAVGLAVSLIMQGLLRLVSQSGSAQLGLTVAAAYLSFTLADYVLGVSGVLSTMTVGLYLGRRARLELNKEAFEGMRHLWEFLGLVANILVFFGVGFAVNSSVLLQAVRYIPLTLAIAYLARALSVYSTLPLVNRLGIARPIGFAYQTVLFWGGLRGGLALGLVLMLPDGFPHKSLFVALAISVVFSTLFVNAMTTGSILRLLRLDRLTVSDEGLLHKSLQMAHASVFTLLSRLGEIGALSRDLVERHREICVLALDTPETGGSEPGRPESQESVRFAVSAILTEERNQYEQLLEDGVLSRAAYRILVQSVQWRSEAFEHGGMEAALETDPVSEETPRVPAKVLSRLGLRRPQGMLRLLKLRLEVLLHFKIALREARERGAHAAALALADRWEAVADEWLRRFYQGYSHYGAAVQALFISEAFRARSRTFLDQLSDRGLIHRAIVTRARQEILKAYRRSAQEARGLLRPSVTYLIARLPLFRDLPKAGIRKLYEGSRKHVFPARHRIVDLGEERSSLFLIVAGMVDVSGKESEPRRLFTGEVFGVRALLRETPQEQSAVAVIATEVLEIEANTLKHVFFEFPHAGKLIHEKFDGASS